jgi:hypothetical protein
MLARECVVTPWNWRYEPNNIRATYSTARGLAGRYFCSTTRLSKLSCRLGVITARRGAFPKVHTRAAF